MCWKGDRVMAWKEHKEGEQFYGFGDKPARLDRAEMAFTNWNTDFPEFGRDTDPIYKTFPFYLAFQAGQTPGPRKTPRRALPLAPTASFSTTRTAPTSTSAPRRAATPPSARTGRAPLLRLCRSADGGRPPPVHAAYGPDAAAAAVGARLPPEPVELLPEYEVRNIAQNFRDRQIPLDSVHLDIHYMDRLPRLYVEPGALSRPSGSHARP